MVKVVVTKIFISILSCKATCYIRLGHVGRYDSRKLQLVV